MPTGVRRAPLASGNNGYGLYNVPQVGGGCRPRPFLAHVLSHPVANFAPESLEIGRPGPGSICTDCQPRRPPWGEFSSPVTDK